MLYVFKGYAWIIHRNILHKFGLKIPFSLQWRKLQKPLYRIKGKYLLRYDIGKSLINQNNELIH